MKVIPFKHEHKPAQNHHKNYTFICQWNTKRVRQREKEKRMTKLIELRAHILISIIVLFKQYMSSLWVYVSPILQRETLILK